MSLIEIQNDLNCKECRYADKKTVGTDNPCCTFARPPVVDNTMKCSAWQPIKPVVTPELKKEIAQFINKHGQFLSNLAERWRDEKEYEDILDYQKAIQARTTVEVVTIKKRPFTVVTKIEGRKVSFIYKMKSSYIEQKVMIGG